ncbi:hypothetical protein EW026_g6726 [Hermanssonia centrifuga]|uniref:Uncharacterized protein n=1 Tax=Hermanssonia centrifuga TaxID=98765 RepID=A0A4S4KA47_9APHY|nr:hypothetical protein EW026_g6726 [Hermanssonia centrifuga]
MAGAFIRGMAFICRDNQPQLDLLIPILLFNMMIEIMTPNTHPYISLVMDFGVRIILPDYAQLPAVGVIVQTQKIAKLRQITKTSDNPNPKTPSKLKCSDTVYKVICPRQKWQMLLMVNELLADHPRQETLAQVRKLKPFFTLGKECYHWISDPLLNLDPSSAEPFEADQTAVFVGEDEEVANVGAEQADPSSLMSMLKKTSR